MPELTADQTVTVVFAENPVPAPTTAYTIIATLLGGDCAISPTGAVSVNEGADQSFDITVNSGVIQFLEVDGALEACNQFGCSYTFNNVAADHTLDVLCN